MDILEVDLGIRVDKVHLRGYLAPFQTLNCLDDARQCGASFKVTDIALDRPHYQRLIPLNRPIDCIDGSKLQWISSGGACALEAQ